MITTRSAFFPAAIEPICLSLTHINGAVQGGDLDRLDGRESGLHQQFDFALIAESGKHVAAAGGIGAGEQQSSGSDEGALQFQIVLPQQCMVDLRREAREAGSLPQQEKVLARLAESSHPAPAGAAADAPRPPPSNTGRVEVIGHVMPHQRVDQVLGLRAARVHAGQRLTRRRSHCRRPASSRDRAAC